MTVHTIDSRKRDERTERLQGLFNVLQELHGVARALEELSQGQSGRPVLHVLAKFQRLQLQELQRRIEFAPGAFDDDIPF